MAFVIVNLVFVAYAALVFVLFQRLPKHRALIIATVLAWQFLPEISFNPATGDMPTALKLPFIKVTKSAVVCLSTFLAVLLFDRQRLFTARPKWFDFAMIGWCLAPLFSSLTNDPPPDGATSAFYDGFTVARTTFQEWGIPYLLGRLYFSEPENFRELVKGFLMAAVLYVPFCLFEIKFSPQLHKWVYGYFQHDFVQTIRGSTFRPMVFMEHGLAVSLWMANATLVGFWLWWTGALTTLQFKAGSKPLPLQWIVPVMLVTLVLMKSAGALVTGVAAMAALASIRYGVGPLLILPLLLGGPMYALGRVTTDHTPVGWATVNWYEEDEVNELDQRGYDRRMFGWAPWTTDGALHTMGSLFGEERTDSLRFRIKNENRFMERWADRPLFGWAGWGRARWYNEENEDMTVVDGYWIATLGDRGAVGLFLFYALFLVPSLRYLWLHPIRTWTDPAVAPGAAVCMILVLYMIDCFSNAMYNPIYLMMAGGLNGVAGRMRQPTPTPMAAARTPVTAVVQRPPTRSAEGRPGVLSRPRPR